MLAALKNSKLLLVVGIVVILIMLINSTSVETPATQRQGQTPSGQVKPQQTQQDPPTKALAPTKQVAPSRDVSPMIVDYTSFENSELVANYFTQKEIDDAISHVGKILTDQLEGKPIKRTCTIVPYGSANGEHNLCEVNHNNCAFLSFGINRDYSFDKQLVTEGCRGAGFDPSDLASGYKAVLEKNLLFLAVGANSLDQVPAHWVMSSVPGLAKLFNMHKLAVLKMDCEGCEYALARDIIIEDPYFFHRVEQFAVEIHVGKFLMTSKEHLQNYGRLLKLLIDAGLELQDASLAPCSPEDENKGCYPGLVENGYPCKFGIMCQNLLFARKV
jgi:hypothetical protein